MPFEVEQGDEFDLDALCADIILPDDKRRMYITDEEKAVELISELIKNKPDPSVSFQIKIENKINQLFSLFSEIALDNEMRLYERFMGLCSRLSERQKIQKIQDKAVISFGGKVSAGKSKFINTISGIGDKLPVDQKTTTAIPTYIVKSNKDTICANSVYGYSTNISSEALNAMAHEFDSVYGIGFSAFVESIIVESTEYQLSGDIALLDTPGYTKYDEKSDSKRVISDRQRAFEQLNVSDYLIWLIDIDGGAITEDDIQFIKSLRIETPILIVFTKADLKPDKEIEQIITVAKKTVNNAGITCFGITAYSANLKKEYGGNEIQKFLNFASSGNVRNSDILAKFRRVEKDMRASIEEAVEQSKKRAKSLFRYISNSYKIKEIPSVAALWGKANQDGYKLDNLLKQYDKIIDEINTEIKKYFREEESM